MSSKRASDPVVSLQDIEVHFESEGGLFGLFSEPEIVRAVDGVSLDIHENEVIALVGESGCGKTTLGKAAIGAQRPTGGTISYRGQDIWAVKDNSRSASIPFEEIRSALQIIHQDPGSSLNPNQRVVQTLDLPLSHNDKGLSTEDRQARILGLLERVGMTPAQDYAERYPHQLSGGEKQRVALIRSLLMQPDLILADEAISALDVSLRVEMMDLMIDLQEEFNTAFLFISHDFSNAKYLAERSGGRIGTMYLGKLVEIGTADELTTDPRHPYTQALRWATPKLYGTQQMEEMPVRRIDIPDPADPPSGCPFHTRCPKAREACINELPTLLSIDDSVTQQAACFREDINHDYWDSEPIEEKATDLRTESKESFSG